MANNIGRFYRDQLTPIVVGLSEKQRLGNERIFRAAECLQRPVLFNDQHFDRLLLNGDFPDFIYLACMYNPILTPKADLCITFIDRAIE